MRGMSRPDSLHALRRQLEQKQTRLTAAFEALSKLEGERRSRSSAHLVAVLLRMIDAEEPLTPIEDSDPLVTAAWLALLPIERGQVDETSPPVPRPGWFVNPEVRGCPPLCVVSVSSESLSVEYYVEGEHPESCVTVSRATFNEMLLTGYEPADQAQRA